MSKQLPSIGRLVRLSMFYSSKQVSPSHQANNIPLLFACLKCYTCTLFTSPSPSLSLSLSLTESMVLWSAGFSSCYFFLRAEQSFSFETPPAFPLSLCCISIMANYCWYYNATKRCSCELSLLIMKCLHLHLIVTVY